MSKLEWDKTGERLYLRMRFKSYRMQGYCIFRLAGG